MPNPKDSHPEFHRRLAWYHFRKWLRPAAPILLPTSRIGHWVNRPALKLSTVEVDRRDWLFRKRMYTERGLKLLAPLQFWSAELNTLVYETEGAVSDGATVPRWLWWVLPPFGRGDDRDYVYAAVAHDKYCHMAQTEEGSPISSVAAANLMREIMVVDGVRPRTLRRIYWAVRIFGPRFKAV